MEILIVDDESSTRDALRVVLGQLGHKPILEAKNGEEGLKLLDAEKNKIRMIIADWEMPYMDGITFSDRIAEREYLDLIPFLLITSDLPSNRLQDLKEKHSRIDHSIYKPFRLKIIEQAIKTAYAVRTCKRDALLWIGTSSPAVALTDAVLRGNTHFKEVVTKSDSRKFSAVLLDIENSELDASAVTSLKKSPLGAQAIWIGLSRDPKRVSSFRAICHQFLDPNSLGIGDGWSNLLNALHARIINGWDIESLSVEVKGLIQQKKTDPAKKLLEKLLVLDPVNAESHAWLADLLVQEGDSLRAIEHELEALRLNPCLPKPYIKLLDILPKSEKSRIAEVAFAANNFCPNNADVLNGAIAALERSDQMDKSLQIKKTLLELAGRKG